MSKVITIHADGSQTIRYFHRCGDCKDCPKNEGISVMGCSNVLPCGQYHCWDDLTEYDCSKCPSNCKRN